MPAVGRAWDAVLTDWKTHESGRPNVEDRVWVETHVLERRDFFLTDDTALLTMCRRLLVEHDLPIVAVRPAAYLRKYR